ncbi:Interactor of constitutive active ROPs 3 [Raphanus sativus]|uniref:Interactor of constitutive active ROPs 3-like n=1 Tax=Raphanus sativus TaxID=3726 RepID=A0A6J0L956_RAPSA|nr:interactor of constitutive active ROPs 3-like [Raphanus sativus]KAJ4875089.1 Interactor of constitutive active ROPs 3 [Raphanus sativus]
MHTQKARNESPDVLKKLSPHATRLVKLEALEPGSSSSPISANNRTPKDKSPKVPDRKSPLSPVSEKKKPSRITELEELVLQEGLKKAQGTVSKTSKKQANQESEESRKQLQEVSMEEADKSRQRAVRVTEQLDATQASNSEMETEPRKLKVQWRKPAEAATAMLPTGNNYNQTNSPYSKVIDDEVTKKKTGNVLKKIGVFWKKPQK